MQESRAHPGSIEPGCALGLILREPAALRHAGAHGLIRLAGIPALAHADRAVRLKLTGAPGAAVGAEPRRRLLCGHATRKQQEDRYGPH
jgi:hypothetical protein